MASLIQQDIITAEATIANQSVGFYSYIDSTYVSRNYLKLTVFYEQLDYQHYVQTVILLLSSISLGHTVVVPPPLPASSSGPQLEPRVGS